MYNVLSIHNGHDGSYTYIENNKIIFHCALDRYSKIKSFSSPSLDLLKLIPKQLDLVIFTVHNYNFTNAHLIALNSLKLINSKTTQFLHYHNSHHHLFHMLAARHFFKSELPCLIADGGGSQDEVETLYRKDKVILKNYTNDKYIGVGPAYSQISWNLFGDEFSEGKAMALSSYGNFNKNMYKKIYFNKDFNKNYFRTLSVQDMNLLFKLTTNKEDIFSQNFIKTFQLACEKKIFKILKRYEIDKIILTGGVAQNILINSFLKNKISEVYAHPLNKDDGLSIGSALLALEGKLDSIENLYLGPAIEIKTNIFEKYKILSVSEEEVCNFLKKDVVAIFQSRSEQGQRGLGNRSLLIDASNPEAFNKINEIKKRAWFRPFACSILEEDAKEWFNCGSSKHMMFVYKVNEKYKNTIKSVLSVDNFSRIQTVEKKDNYHYYNLINQFKKMFKIPLLLNTSLNLPNHPLVETLEDLKFLFENTSLKYIYLPEIKKLICKI
jgi:carbamoyltransferase